MNSLNQILPSVLDAIRERRHQSIRDSDKQSALFEVVERVVDGTDAKIRLVPGYRRKLLSLVEGALEYVDQLIDQFPEPLDLSPKNFMLDPYVNAFFVSPWDLKRVVWKSPELHDFLEQEFSDDAQECCVLLCMLKTEREILGVEISDNQVRRDVKQTSVSFSDHQILSPADTERGARKELKCCVFGGLITNALSKIEALRATRRRLESKQRVLRSRMRSLESSNTLVSGPAGASIERELIEIEGKLSRLGYMTPEVILQQVDCTLSQPEAFLSVEKVMLEVDKMGIKTTSESQRVGNRLDLTEVKIKGELARIVTLARLRRDELAEYESSNPEHL